MSLKSRLLNIKPVSSYRAWYPGHGESGAEALAREHLFRRFSGATVAVAALLGGGTGLLRAADEESDSIKKVDAKKIQAVVDRYLSGLGEKDEMTSLVAKKILENNPDITVPVTDRHVKGVVAARVFDASPVREAARELFELYGIHLKENQSYKKDGVEFTVDGFDPDKKIGYEMDVPNASSETVKTEELSDPEQKELDGKIQKSEVNVLLMPSYLYSEWNPLASDRSIVEAYLKSIVDYLEWLRTSGKI